MIYSLLARDAGLARELWIRLEEGETTFAEAAHQHGAGEEAQRKGVIGPISIGMLYPEVLQEILRSLRPGNFLLPVRLVSGMFCCVSSSSTPQSLMRPRVSRCSKKLSTHFLDERVKRVLAGEADSLEPIHYDLEP